MNKSKTIEKYPFASIENQPGHSALMTLKRRGNELAKSYLYKDLKKFHFLVQKTWDEVYARHNVKCIYELPKKEIETTNTFLGNKLKDIYSDSQHEYLSSLEDENKFKLAMKLVCFLDYGFLEFSECGCIKIKRLNW